MGLFLEQKGFGDCVLIDLSCTRQQLFKQDITTEPSNTITMLYLKYKHCPNKDRTKTLLLVSQTMLLFEKIFKYNLNCILCDICLSDYFRHAIQAINSFVLSMINVSNKALRKFVEVIFCVQQKTIFACIKCFMFLNCIYLSSLKQGI